MKKIYFVFLLLLFISASDKKYQPYEGFKLKDFEKSLCYIPGDTVMLGMGDIDTPYLEERTRLVGLNSFYLSNHEVTNGEYMEFISDLKKTDTVKCLEMLPDTVVWRIPRFYYEPYVEYYLRHPAYSNYPVVGVSHEQAIAYCTWLTDKYATFADRKFNEATFRLPTSDEWTYAAGGGIGDRFFPWDGVTLFDEKGKPLANFTVINQAHICKMEFQVRTIYDTLVAKEYLIAFNADPMNMNDLLFPARSFQPNEFGLYNMAGNVEEMVAKNGISKGGSWYDTGYYLMLFTRESYDTLQPASFERGFRIAMDIAEG